MHGIHRLRNTVQRYAWGSRSDIAELIGEPVPSPTPQAELWMGAHPLAPSLVVLDGAEMPLDAWIASDPASILGARTASEFGSLPFLLKVLAAARPLSIQAHPDASQAREGFSRESAAGIPLDSPERCYRDPGHKPELICALKPFSALNGFRPPRSIRALLDALGVDEVRDLAPLDQGLETFFTTLMTSPPALLGRAVDLAARAARRLAADPVFDWIVRLHAEHPGDPGVLSPLFLNLVRLDPGQAMALPSGRLHAYLEGAGIEIMASSDNVLRGGLTPKHVDVPELVRILSFEPSDPAPTSAVRVSSTEMAYPPSAREFALSVVRVTPASSHSPAPLHGIEILLCTEGAGRIADLPSGRTLDLARGSSFVVPASSSYAIEGDATLYRARVP